MLFYSSNLCFFVRLSETEVHRLRPIELTKGVRRVWVIPMGAKTGCLKVELSVQRNIHSRLKGGGVYPECFRFLATPVRSPSMKMVTKTISGKGSSRMVAIRVLSSWT